jgi:predicted phage terminase large subunit-like protein
MPAKLLTPPTISSAVSLAELDPKTERALARSSPAGLAYVASRGRWQAAPHLLLVAERLCAIERGELDRLMIFQPPRSGKSMLTSHYTPPWFIGRNPDKRVILASFGAKLASDWGRKSRDVLEAWGPTLFDVQVSPRSAASDHWNLLRRGGGMNTAGVGGPITGFGADLLIIDDPLKDAEEAGSEVIRQKQKEWYQSTARTRLMPGGAVVLMQTRWHEDDLAGWLLQEMRDGGDQWDIIVLPAIAEEDDELGRAEGEALWPERFPLHELERTKRAVGGYYFAAMYQQRPVPAGGALFKRHDFRYFTEAPELDLFVMRGSHGDEDRPVGRGHCYRFVTCDPAFSEKETADFTALGLWGVTPWMDLLLLDVARIRFDVENLPAAIHRHFELWKPNDIRIESKAFGTRVINALVNQGLPIIPLDADTDKVTRALSAVPRYECHAVFHRSGGEYVEAYERELLSFPQGAHDDQVDMFAYAALALPQLQLVPVKQSSTGETMTGGLRDLEL